MRETNDRHEITHVKHLMPFWKIYSYKILFAFELEQMHSRDRLFFDIHHVFITYPEHDIINNVCKKCNLLLLHRKWKLILWIHGKFQLWSLGPRTQEYRKGDRVGTVPGSRRKYIVLQLLYLGPMIQECRKEDRRKVQEYRTTYMKKNQQVDGKFQLWPRPQDTRAHLH